MKTLALLTILALHSTGLWGRVPSSSQDRLNSTAAGQSASAEAPSGTSTAFSFPAVALPVRTTEAPPPSLDAVSVLAIDRATATVLYQNNPDAKRPIASITKLITALVVSAGHRPEEVVTVPTLPSYIVEAETMGLVPGDTLTIKQLLDAALVPSENDAADTLAITDSGSVKAFAVKMNAKMAQWGIKGTHFASASGLEDTDNYASATALSQIASLSLLNPAIAEAAAKPQISLTSGAGRVYNLKSTNNLLASGQFYGIKTGYTLRAGECFVGLARINGHEVITVVLGSTDRFGTTTTLTNWIGRNWQWL